MIVEITAWIEAERPKFEQEDYDKGVKLYEQHAKAEKRYEANLRFYKAASEKKVAIEHLKNSLRKLVSKAERNPEVKKNTSEPPKAAIETESVNEQTEEPDDKKSEKAKK